MIRRPTVFVVGAGGSVPYGFPSGPKLLRIARDRTPLNLYNDTLKRFQLPVAAKFHQALLDTASNSIDSLLEHRSDLDLIGRSYIAKAILEAEWDNFQNRPDSGDWLGYLFDQLDTGGSADSFFKNPVTFITYNYDRLIEYWFSRGLRARYRVEEKELTRLWRENPMVVRLHGSVGAFAPGTGHVPFGARVDGRSGGFEEQLLLCIDEASSMVKVVHQADRNATEFARARDALKNAECVIFMGFSFGNANVDRLGFENVNPKADIVCGRFGMSDAEASVFIREPFKKLLGLKPAVAHPGLDCETLLRANLNLFVKRYAE